MITLTLADRSGPILLEAWRDVAETLVRDYVTWSETSENRRVYVDVERFEVKEDTRTHQTSMRKVHLTDHSVVKPCLSPTQAALTDSSIRAHPNLFTRDFNRLASPLPFVINICGIVSATSGETVSGSQESMQTFRLQDNTGRFAQCRAFGRHAGSANIRDGMEVIIYFGQAQRGWNQQPGQIWVYDEAHVVVLRHDVKIPPARHLIELRS